MLKAVYFDLFFTLITPLYGKQDNEFDILGLSMEEWEQYAEDTALYRERALGLVRSETEIMDKIMALMPYGISGVQKQKVLDARRERMRRALQNVPADVTDVLESLRVEKVKIGWYEDGIYGSA